MPSATAILFSGGLDSSILLDVLSRPTVETAPIVPIYVDCGSAWQRAERAAAQRFITLLDGTRVLPLVELTMPTDDLYGDHWSLGVGAIPDAESPDDAVYLPGRNALLAVKPLVWCGLHGIGRLALATLASNPFADARTDFFTSFSQALSIAMAVDLEIMRPFAGCSKTDVMRQGRPELLHETFSCIDPQPDAAEPARFIHCGACNKCAERRQAFHAAGIADQTPYRTVRGEGC